MIRPLDPISSIKLKMSVLLLLSGAAGVAYLYWIYRWVPPILTVLMALAIVIGTALLLSRGMTRPLREMTAATRSMAQGDYSRRVRASSRDEVGQLAEAFNRMAADLAAADQQRRDLIANVSHELRTPIAALQAVLENVVDGIAAPDPATMQTALVQTERLSRLVAELLDLSRIDAGAMTLQVEEFAVAPLLDEAAAEARVAAGVAGRGIGFLVEVPEGTRVRADRSRLHQVVVNLLDNAARHGPPGSEVRVSGHEEGDRLVIEVRDRGPGIDPADRTRVFHRFTRGERAGGGGTGLGLSIAHWVVDLHGGEIGAHDAVDGPGCRIRVSLPGLAPSGAVR